MRSIKTTVLPNSKLLRSILRIRCVLCVQHESGGAMRAVHAALMLVGAEQAAGVSCQMHRCRIMGWTVTLSSPVITSTEAWPPAATSQKGPSLLSLGSRKL